MIVIFICAIVSLWKFLKQPTITKNYKLTIFILSIFIAPIPIFAPILEFKHLLISVNYYVSILFFTFAIVIFESLIINRKGKLFSTYLYNFSKYGKLEIEYSKLKLYLILLFSFVLIFLLAVLFILTDCFDKIYYAKELKEIALYYSKYIGDIALSESKPLNDIVIEYLNGKLPPEYVFLIPFGLVLTTCCLCLIFEDNTKKYIAIDTDGITIPLYGNTKKEIRVTYDSEIKIISNEFLFYGIHSIVIQKGKKDIATIFAKYLVGIDEYSFLKLLQHITSIGKKENEMFDTVSLIENSVRSFLNGVDFTEKSLSIANNLISIFDRVQSKKALRKKDIVELEEHLEYIIKEATLIKEASLKNISIEADLKLYEEARKKYDKIFLKIYMDNYFKNMLRDNNFERTLKGTEKLLEYTIIRQQRIDEILKLNTDENANELAIDAIEKYYKKSIKEILKLDFQQKL
jgi:hypothetical protein